MSTQDIRAGGAYVKLGIKGDFGKQLDVAARRLKAFGESVSNIGRQIGTIGAAIVVPLLGAAAAAGVLGRELETASQKTGMSVEALSALKFAAEDTGAAFEDVTTGIRFMQRSLEEAAGGSAKSTDALHALGLTVNQLKGLNPSDQFKLIAERMGTLTSAAQRTAVAMALFGRGGTALLPMILQIDELTEKAKTLGVVMSTEDAQSAAKFESVLTDLYAQLRAVTFQAGEAVAEALTPFANALRAVLPGVIDFVRENKPLIQSALAIGAALVGVGGTLVVFGQTLKIVGSSWMAVSGLFRTGGMLIKSFIALPVSLAVGAFNALLGAAGLVGTVIAGIGTTFAAVGAALAFIVTPVGLLIVGLAAVAAAAIYFSGALGEIGKLAGTVGSAIGSKFSSALKDAKAVFVDLKSTALETFHGIADALSAGDIALAGKILWAGMRLTWAEGTIGLKDEWSKFTQAWADTTAGISGVWDAIVSTMVDAWGTLSTAVEKTLNDIHAAYAWVTGGDYTAGKDNADADASDDAKKQARAKKELDAATARQNALDADVAANKKHHDELVQQEKDLQAQLDALRKSAGDKKAAKEKTDAAAAAKQTAATNAGDDITPVKQPKSVGQIGLFNVAGIRGLDHGGGVQDRIAKATEETAKNTNPQAQHAAWMAGIKAQNQGTGVSYGIARPELTDATKRADGNYDIKSRLTGIVATVTAEQLAMIRAAAAAAPKLPDAQIAAGVHEALQRRNIMEHKTPGGVKGDPKTANIADNTAKANTFLEKLAGNLPINTFT